jgi:hypothetical protein
MPKVKILDLHLHPGAGSGYRLTGTFNGPVEMLAVIVGAVTYFAV